MSSDAEGKESGDGEADPLIIRVLSGRSLADAASHTSLPGEKPLTLMR